MSAGRARSNCEAIDAPYNRVMRSRERPEATIGSTILALRTTIGWSQRELGRRARLSQAMVCAIERGDVGELTFATADRLLTALGARLVINVDAPFLGDRRRQRDPAHARLATHVAGRLRRAGWEVRTEVEVGGDRSRGWIDVLAFRPTDRAALVIEIKTEIHDLGEIERRFGWYEREAWGVARRLGWRPATLTGCLLLLATDAIDSRAAANRRSLDDAFPGRSRPLNAWLAGDPAPLPGRAMAMVDPRSRRRDWCRPLGIDGRCTAAPYVDYADFMRRTRSTPGARRPR